EQISLQRILCNFSMDLDIKDIICRKICAMNLMVALRQRTSPAHKAPVKKESPRSVPSPMPVEIPLIRKKTQCIFYTSNKSYSYKKRTCCFRRVSHIMDHIKNLHLNRLPADEKLSCHHPICKSDSVVLNDINHFKNHVARTQSITLREPNYVG
ncbi:FluG domain-containing protein, partial [Hyaloscypha sp. PMI_1271]